MPNLIEQLRVHCFEVKGSIKATQVGQHMIVLTIPQDDGSEMMLWEYVGCQN